MLLSRTSLARTALRPALRAIQRVQPASRHNLLPTLRPPQYHADSYPSPDTHYFEAIDQQWKDYYRAKRRRRWRNLGFFFLGFVPTSVWFWTDFEEPNLRKQVLLLHIRMCEEHPEFDLPENLAREFTDAPPRQAWHGNLFVNGVLADPGILPQVERKFWDNDLQMLLCTTYVGMHASGWPGVAHGGIIATMLSEVMGETVWRLNRQHFQSQYPSDGMHTYRFLWCQR